MKKTAIVLVALSLACDAVDGVDPDYELRSFDSDGDILPEEYGEPVDPDEAALMLAPTVEEEVEVTVATSDNLLSEEAFDAVVALSENGGNLGELLLEHPEWQGYFPDVTAALGEVVSNDEESDYVGDTYTPACPQDAAKWTCAVFLEQPVWRPTHGQKRQERLGPPVKTYDDGVIFTIWRKAWGRVAALRGPGPYAYAAAHVAEKTLAEEVKDVRPPYSFPYHTWKSWKEDRTESATLKDAGTASGQLQVGFTCYFVDAYVDDFGTQFDLFDECDPKMTGEDPQCVGEVSSRADWNAHFEAYVDTHGNDDVQRSYASGALWGGATLGSDVAASGSPNGGDLLFADDARAAFTGVLADTVKVGGEAGGELKYTKDKDGHAVEITVNGKTYKESSFTPANERPVDKVFDASDQRIRPFKRRGTAELEFRYAWEHDIDKVTSGEHVLRTNWGGLGIKGIVTCGERTFSGGAAFIAYNPRDHDVKPAAQRINQWLDGVATLPEPKLQDGPLTDWYVPILPRIDLTEGPV